MTLRVGHGNGHNEPALVDFVRAADAASFSCLEAQLLLEELGAIPRHRVTGAGDGWTEERGRAKSTCIVTRDRHPNIGEMTRKVSERIDRFERVAPDRVLVASMYEHPVATDLGYEGVAHFALHPDAGPDALNGDDPRHPIVREYREALQSTWRWMRAARDDGLLLVLTGDLQVRAGNDQPWSPRVMVADRLDLGVKVVGIDWLMFDRRLSLAAFNTRQLHDHTGFVADLTAA